MLTRQKILLTMLKRAARPVQRLELTKWCFLLRHESSCQGGSAFYDFVPYRYGPFSFGLYQEADKLVIQGYVRELDDATWISGPVMPPTLPSRSLESEVDRIITRFGGMEVDALLDHVYSRYPYFTVNSKRKRLARRKSAPPAVYTAGYEGKTIDGFLNLLVESGIEHLIDVRINPIARRYGFHRSTLSRLCNNLGIAYTHVPELGIPSELRANVRSAADYAELFRRYSATTLCSQTDAIRRVAGWMKDSPSVLVCMEASAECCHRSHLAIPVSEISGLDVIHLV